MSARRLRTRRQAPSPSRPDDRAAERDRVDRERRERAVAVRAGRVRRDLGEAHEGRPQLFLQREHGGLEESAANIYNVAGFAQLANRGIPRCDYDQISKVAFSRGGALGFAKQTCGFRDDVTRYHWFKAP